MALLTTQSRICRQGLTDQRRAGRSARSVTTRALSQPQESGLVSRRSLGLGLGAAGALLASPSALAESLSIYELSSLYKGQPRSLDEFKGQVAIVVNIASEWGLANLAYSGLRKLHGKYAKDGFNVIGYPCNQFGGQAPRSSDGEREWAFRKFECTDCINVMDKIEVNGANEDPVWHRIKAATKTGDLRWNYTFALIDRNGIARKRLNPPGDPMDLEQDIRLLLAGKDPLPPECKLHPFRINCVADKLLGA